MATSDTTFVLVHGAWADGSSWSKVITHLLRNGRKVVTGPLPLTTFADDVASLERTVERVGGPVVLVAHAYAGAVIGATRHPAVKALVYVAALVPDEGETVADVYYRAEPHPMAPHLSADGHGVIWLPERAFAQAFAPNATPEEQALLAATQRPISAGCISVAVPRPRWKDVPAWYLLAEQDRMIVASTQRFMAERANASIVSHPVDHAPGVTAPDAVVDLILQAARAVSA
ncbi:MAG: alpha/beta fold hydrolase [Luteibacter jiangsuensis]